MGYTVIFGGIGRADVFSLATTGGLAALSRWVDSLPDEGFGVLKAFVGDGTAKDTEALASQLSAAHESHPIEDPDVLHTAQGLAAVLGVGSPDESAHIAIDGGEPGEWSDEDEPRNGRCRRYNPHHGPDGKFTSGHGIGGARPRDGTGGNGVQPYAHQINDPTPHGASTAHGHDIKGEVPGTLNYSLVSGPEVFGVKIPTLSDSQKAKIDARIDRATTPPKSHRAPEKWKGRDEEEVHSHVLNLHDRIGEMHAHVANAEGDDLANALRDRNQGAGNALALAYAREIMPRIDAKVKSGELVRTFEDHHNYAVTRLRRPRAGEVPRP